MKKVKVVSKLVALSSIWMACVSSPSWAINCDGKVTAVLSGSAYCSAGERVGFQWSGGSQWLCSGNKNMDALIMSAYVSQKNISVRDRSWNTCRDARRGYVPNHIWFK